LGELVGAAHKEILGSLIEAFERVHQQRGPELHIIEGVPGVGKTRLIQELFAELSARQPVPRYWPPEIDATDDWRSARKAIYPTDVQVEKDAQIPWMWWGLSCFARPDGRPHQALFEDAPQLVAHAESITNLPTSGVAGATFDIGSAFIGLLSIVGVALIGPAAGVVAVVGAARAYATNREVIDKVKQARRQRKRARLLDPALAGRSAEIADLSALTVALSESLPFIIVIDDAHAVDTTLAEFLNGLMSAPNAQVLIIATAWPSGADAPAPYRLLREGAPGSTRPQVHRLGLLDIEAAGALIRGEYAGNGLLSATAEAEILRHTSPNPLAIRLMLALPGVQRALESGSLDAALQPGTAMELEQIMASYWQSLPDQLQQVLAIASLAGVMFLPGPIIAAAMAEGIADAARWLREGRDVNQILTRLGDEAQCFVDPVMHEIARREGRARLGDQACEQMRQQIMRDVTGIDVTTVSYAGAWLIWDAQRAAFGTGQLDLSTLVKSGARLAVAAADRLEVESAIDIVRAVLQILESEAHRNDDHRSGMVSLTFGSSDLVMYLRSKLAKWCAEAGRHEEAVGIYRSVLWASDRRNGRDSRESTDIVAQIAYSLLASNEHVSALLMLLSIRGLGGSSSAESDTPEWLVRRHLATAYIHLGDVESAWQEVNELERLVALDESLSPELRDILRSLVAAERERCTHIERSMTMINDLLELREPTGEISTTARDVLNQLLPTLLPVDSPHHRVIRAARQALGEDAGPDMGRVLNLPRPILPTPAPGFVDTWIGALEIPARDSDASGSDTRQRKVTPSGSWFERDLFFVDSAAVYPPEDPRYLVVQLAAELRTIASKIFHVSEIRQNLDLPIACAIFWRLCGDSTHMARLSDMDDSLTGGFQGLSFIAGRIALSLGIISMCERDAAALIGAHHPLLRDEQFIEQILARAREHDVETLVDAVWSALER
jgi:hypothetical protein